MKRASLFILAFLAGALISVPLLVSGQSEPQTVISAAVTPTGTLDVSGLEAYGIAIRDGSGNTIIVPFSGDLAATEIPPTNTPTATVTPSATPTATRTPTPTLAPTDAPTQEITVVPTAVATALPKPTETNTPTPSPTPNTAICEGTTTVNLILRDAVAGVKIVTLATGTKVTILQMIVYADGIEEWAKIRTNSGQVGYVKSRHPETSTRGLRYLEWDALADACNRPLMDIEYPNGNDVPHTMFGVKAVPGANWAEMVIAGNILKAAGITPVASVVQEPSLATFLKGNGWFTNFVPWSAFPGDCADISLPAETSARLRVEYAARQVGDAKFDVITLTNECHWPSVIYLNDWIVEAVKQCAVKGWVCIPVVFNTGTPPADWIPQMSEGLTALKQSGGYFGINIYPYDPVKLMTRTDFTSYTTYNYERILAAMRPGANPPIFVTEFAQSGGGETPDLLDMAAFYRVTGNKLAALCAWYFGPPLGAWPRATLTGQLEQLARLIAG